MIELQETDLQEDVFAKVEELLEQQIIGVDAVDGSRPWGGFFVIRELDAPLFIESFFPELKDAAKENFGRISPKILVVAPGKRLSWQYHHRRSEIWKILAGEAFISISPTDEESAPQRLEPGTPVEIGQGQRHRLIGGNNWGVVAEIWKHTDAEKPSDEDDIVRITDDFGRNSP